MLFHAGLGAFSGGFVGVDVFFVISGFLITRIILRDDFSLLGFYERRVRRIVPALAAMMLAVAIVGWLWLLPWDLEDLGQSMVATTGFASNVLFFIETNYFASNDSKLLLHTWSLAVEEQFYIFFPLMVMALKRWAPGIIRPAFVGFAILSLLLSTWLAYRHGSAAFYLPFSRAWELLLGAIVAAYPKPPRPLELASAVGLAGIVGSFFWLTSKSIFPGLSAVPACAGTALIIYGGQSGVTRIGRVLSAKPLVGIGLISYSLYLWHWPLLVFLRYRLIRAPEWYETGMVLAATFIIAFLSWRFVESPVRSRRFSRRQVFAGASVAAVAVAATGAAFAFTHGAPSRFPPSIVELAAARDSSPSLAGCQSIAGGYICGSGTSLIWGDSHARALLPVAPGYVSTANGCPPAMGTELRNHYVRCKPYDDAVLAFIQSHDIRTVILAARWDTYLGPQMFAEGNIEIGMARTFAVLKGRRVYVMATVPGGSTAVSSALARMQAFHSSADIRRSTNEYLADESPVFRLFAGQNILFPHRYFCREKCDVQGSGPLYGDSSHLTAEGAERLRLMLDAAASGR